MVKVRKVELTLDEVNLRVIAVGPKARQSDSYGKEISSNATVEAIMLYGILDQLQRKEGSK